MTNFQDGMRIRCGECGEQAQNHRLTPGGSFYCLKLDPESNASYKYYRYETVTPSNERRIASRVPVRNLIHADLPRGLGLALQQAISGFVESPA